MLGGDVSTPAAGWDAVYGDDFALANTALDKAAGLASPAQTWASGDPQVASLNGTFEGPSEGLVQECTGWAEECARVQANIFANEGETFFELTTDCTNGPCTLAVVFNVDASAGGSSQVTAPLAFDGSRYSLDYTSAKTPTASSPTDRPRGGGSTASADRSCRRPPSCGTASSS